MQRGRSGRQMKIRCPLHINKQKARNSCHIHVPNNITAMNNLSYCVCDPSNYSPGYILKVNLKELDGGTSSFTDTQTNVNPHGKQAYRKDRPSAGRHALAVLDSSNACWVGCLSLCLFDRNTFDGVWIANCPCSVALTWKIGSEYLHNFSCLNRRWFFATGGIFTAHMLPTLHLVYSSSQSDALDHIKSKVKKN